MTSKITKQRNNDKYLPQILKYGAKFKTGGVYEFAEFLIYPSMAHGKDRKTGEHYNIEDLIHILRRRATEGIYCCGCEKKVRAKLVKGNIIYPHREDLKSLNFYQCKCGLSVGCHKNSLKPLGCIATAELKEARHHIHNVLDPMWQQGRWTRSSIYTMLSEKFKKEYHTAEIRTIEEARKVWKYLVWINNLCVRHDKINNVNRSKS